MSLSATIALVGSGGFVLALILGLIAGNMLGGESKKEEDLWASSEQAPDSDGLPSFVDESGVYWRQQPDGTVDWLDATENQWLRFQQ